MTDSNSGITPEEGKKIGIYSLPMPVIIEGDVFYEGKNITQEEYYGAMTPVTQMAAVSVAEADIGFSTISLEIPKRLVIISLLTAPTPELQMTRYSMIFSSSRILPGQL